MEKENNKLFKNFCKKFKLNSKDENIKYKSFENSEINFESVIMIKITLKFNVKIALFEPKNINFYFNENKLIVKPNNYLGTISKTKKIEVFYSLNKNDERNEIIYTKDLVENHFKIEKGE